MLKFAWKITREAPWPRNSLVLVFSRLSFLTNWYKWLFATFFEKIYEILDIIMVYLKVFILDSFVSVGTLGILAQSSVSTKFKIFVCLRPSYDLQKAGPLLKIKITLLKKKKLNKC